MRKYNKLLSRRQSSGSRIYTRAINKDLPRAVAARRDESAELKTKGSYMHSRAAHWGAAAIYTYVCTPGKKNEAARRGKSVRGKTAHPYTGVTPHDASMCVCVYGSTLDPSIGISPFTSEPLSLFLPSDFVTGARALYKVPICTAVEGISRWARVSRGATYARLSLLVLANFFKILMSDVRQGHLRRLLFQCTDNILISYVSVK